MAFHASDWGGSDTQGRTNPLLCFLYMFNTNILVTRRTSGAVAQLIVNPVTGNVIVEFKNGYAYSYSNVSRRAIINLLAQPNMSLGFWVNNNCVNAKRTNTLSLQFVWLALVSYTLPSQHDGFL